MHWFPCFIFSLLIFSPTKQGLNIKQCSHHRQKTSLSLVNSVTCAVALPFLELKNLKQAKNELFFKEKKRMNFSIF
jgi:hypothetical protein